MNYTQLELQTYLHETIASNVYAREAEYFHYDFDRKNFEYLITNLPDGPYKDNIKERLSSTIEQMGNVEAVCAALKSQIKDPVAYEAAVIKTRNDRLLAESKEK